MTTIETSLHPALLASGLVASVVLFVVLARRDSRGLPAWARAGILASRVVLCVLVWWLIAQPRAVTRDDVAVPVTLNLGIDQSGSMKLTDSKGGLNTAWHEQAPPGALDEAIALTEAAKIRLHLISMRADPSGERLAGDLSKTLAILSDASKRVETHGRDANLERLTRGPIENLNAAVEALGHADGRTSSAAILRCAGIVADAAQELRRLAVLNSGDTGRNPDDVPRIDLVNRWLERSESWLREFGKKHELRLAGFSDSLVPLELGGKLSIPAAGADVTRLHENLERMATGGKAGGRPINVVITDGVECPDDPTARLSNEIRNHPLIVLPIGDLDRDPDIRIESVVSPARVRMGDRFVATASLAAHCANAVTVTVTLSEGAEVLSSQQVTLNGGERGRPVELEWMTKVPEHKEFKVEVSPIEGEKILYNNIHHLETTVVADKYRIMVCDGFPRWETRYLQNLFRRDPDIEASTIVFQPLHSFPGNPPPVVPALPLAIEAWKDFNLVVLGDVTPTQLTPEHQQVLADYVEQGGNLMIIAGQNAMPALFSGMPLEKLLPVTRVSPTDPTGRFVISPPSDSAPSPIVSLGGEGTASAWREQYSASPCYRISPWARAKESGQRLLVAKDAASGATYDFLTVQRYGRGRVAFAAAPCFYHLRHAHGDRYHLRFWGSLIRGMCAEEFGYSGGKVKTRLDRQLWSPGTEVQGRVRVRDKDDRPAQDEAYTAVLTREGQPVARLVPEPDPARPGDYFLRFPGLSAGDYSISYEGGLVGDLWKEDVGSGAAPAECRFRVSDESLGEEMQHATRIPGFWNEVNSLPLGAVVHPQTLPLVLDAIDLKTEPLSIVQSRPIWDTWILLLAVVAVSGTEWLLRRTQGLC